MLSADTPLDNIREYQRFFKVMPNRPFALVPSPKTAYMWQNMSRIQSTAMILRDGAISDLPVNINPAVESLTFERKNKSRETVGEHFSSQTASATMDAMIVIHKGVIVHEKYKTMRPFDKHNWFSGGKVISSTLIGLMEDEGKVDVEQSVGLYLPELAGSPWDMVTVQQVLDMATGLDSTEHDEPARDARINPERGWFQWAAAMGVYPDVKQLKLTPFEVLRRMKRVRPGNTAFEYNSINTWVLEMIVERVSDKPIAELFGERVWRKMGAQSDAYIMVSPDGYPMAWGLSSSTLRDMARFGMLFSPSWDKISKERIISDRIIERIQTGGDPAIYDKGFVGQMTLTAIHDTVVKNSYQWDAVFTDGDFYKEGVGGQGLYVSPTRDLVMAWFSTGKNDELAMARSVATSGLFEKQLTGLFAQSL